MDFDELWESDGDFREIFYGQYGMFPSEEEVDFDLARELWEGWYPRTNWGICQKEGCYGFVQEGEYCRRHYKEGGSLPTWRWYRGVIYRFIRTTDDNRDVNAYMSYLEHVAIRKYGRLPPGFKIVMRDGNPFNFHWDNVFILSKPMMAAWEAGAIDLPTAVQVDETVPEFMGLNRGRKPFLGVYSYYDISKAARSSMASVRKAVERESLDPNNLLSVVKFVKDRQSG